MKAVTFLCATLVMAPVMAGELVAHAGGNTIRLAEGQCTSETVLRRLEPELQSQQSAGRLWRTVRIEICRIKRPNAFDPT